MAKGITAAGTLVADEVNYLDAYPSKGMLAPIKDVALNSGGVVANVLLDLRQIDSNLPLKACAAIGCDGKGEFLKHLLDDHQIDTRGLIQLSSSKTGFTEVMCEKGGERTFFTFDGANALFDESSIDVSSLDCKIFHLGYALLLKSLDSSDKEYGTKMARLLKDVQSRGIKTSLDMVSKAEKGSAEAVRFSLPYTDYLIINEIEAGILTGLNPRQKDNALNIEQMKKICQKLMSYGIKEMAVIHCPEGSFALDAAGAFCKCGSCLLPPGFIENTVGAGDAFCAGCLYSLLENIKGQEMLSFASACAAMSLKKGDAYSGIGSKEEIAEFASQYPRRPL